MNKHFKEEAGDQETFISSKSDARLYLRTLSILLFAFFCITGSIIILAFSFILFQDYCARCRSQNEDTDSRNLGAVLGLIAVPLCIIGGLTDFRKMSRTARGRPRVLRNRLW